MDRNKTVADQAQGRMNAGLPLVGRLARSRLPAGKSGLDGHLNGGNCDAWTMNG
jgi:hypothetical protein